MARFRWFFVRRGFVCFLVFVCVLAFCLRFAGLASESVWLDEALSIRAAGMGACELVDWTAHDIHPPFYYFALKAWAVFGGGEFVFRSFSALFGVFTVLAVFLVCVRLFGFRVGVVASLLLAVNPVNVYYSQEVRMFSLMAFLVFVSCFLFLRCLSVVDWRVFLVYVVVSAVMLYTHYFGVLVFCFQVFYFVLLRVFRVGFVRDWRRVVLCFLVVFLLFVPWVPVLVGVVFHPEVSMAWMPRPDFALLRDCYFGLVGGFAPDVVGVSGVWVLLFVPVLFFVVGLVAGFVRLFSVGFFFSCVALFPVLLFVFSVVVMPVLLLRQVSVFVPEVLVVLSVGFWRVVSWVSGWRRRFGRFFVVFGVCFLVCVNLVSVFELHSTLTKEDWRGVAAGVEEFSGGVPVVLPLWYVRVPFEYYYRGDSLVVDAYSVSDVDGVVEGFDEFLLVVPLYHVNESLLLGGLMEKFYVVEWWSYLHVDVYYLRRLV